SSSVPQANVPEKPIAASTTASEVRPVVLRSLLRRSWLRRSWLMRSRILVVIEWLQVSAHAAQLCARILLFRSTKEADKRCFAWLDIASGAGKALHWGQRRSSAS